MIEETIKYFCDNCGVEIEGEQSPLKVGIDLNIPFDRSPNGYSSRSLKYNTNEERHVDNKGRLIFCNTPCIKSYLDKKIEDLTRED